MKILHVYRDYSSPGGVPEQTRALASAQANLAHHVAAACVRGFDMVESRGVHVHCFNNALKSIFQMFLLQAFKKFDIIHITRVWILFSRLYPGCAGMVSKASMSYSSGLILVVP